MGDNNCSETIVDQFNDGKIFLRQRTGNFELVNTLNDPQFSDAEKEVTDKMKELDSLKLLKRRFESDKEWKEYFQWIEDPVKFKPTYKIEDGKYLEGYVPSYPDR